HSTEVNTMGKTFRYCPQLEVLEDRLPPGDLRGGLSHHGRGGEVLPATAHSHGFSLTDMAAATALFNTSGNNLSLYPQTPFQILYVDRSTETFSVVNGGLVVTGTNQFTVAPGTPFYVPVAFVDDSPPILGTFPTDPSTVADYIFAHDQVGMTDLRTVPDGRR